MPCEKHFRRGSRWRAAGALIAAAVFLTGCAAVQSLSGGPSPEDRQASVLESQQKFEAAMPLRQANADRIERTQPADSLAVGDALYALANDQVYVAQSNRMFEHKDTRPLFAAVTANAHRALAIYEHIYKPDDWHLTGPLRELGLAARFQNDPAEAKADFQRILDIYQKTYGPKDLHVAYILSEIAQLDESTLDFADEEPLLKQDLALYEAAPNPDPQQVAQSLDTLAGFETERLGRYDLGEDYYSQAIAVREKALPPGQFLDSADLLGLAVVYQRQNRAADAEPLVRRALASDEKHYGASSHQVGTVLNLLGSIEDALGKFADERATLQRELAIYRQVFGDYDPDVAVTLTSLGSLARRQGNLAEARAELTQAAAILGTEPQNGNPAAAHVAAEFAKLDLADHRLPEGERYARNALAISSAMAGDADPDVFHEHDILARILTAENRLEPALSEATAAVNGARQHELAESASLSSGGLSEQRDEHDLFLDQIEIAASVAAHDPRQTPALEATGFATAQLAQASSTAEAVAGMAARFAAGGDALATVIRERQDDEARWRQLDANLVQAQGLPADQRSAAAETAMRAEIATVQQKLAAIDQRLATEFPKYAEIANPAPVALDEARKLLQPGEAMLVYSVGEEDTFIWALTPQRAAMFRAKIGRAALAQAVTTLRKGLDPSDIDIATADDIPPFDVTAAWQLFEQIFAPAEPIIGNAKVVFVVPDAALQSLPLGVLVTDKPAGPVTGLAGYRQVHWLERRYATTTLPSVSALRALRLFTERDHAAQPFLGIGDPALHGGPGATRGVKLAQLFRGGTADVDTVRSLPELPETAGELRAIAASLGAGPSDLVLRDQARKPAVMKLDFAQYRVVAFATHGLVAGDLTGLAQPALVLTPPPIQAGPDDDGLLTASDITRLTLNADWVVLSACNTAAGDGSPDAEGLSGLAKAFFYAGSRALLVSHWPVFSDASVKLTTGTFDALARDPAMPRAVALQRAILALQADDSAPYDAHPMAWAPFVLVGDGGAM